MSKLPMTPLATFNALASNLTRRQMQIMTALFQHGAMTARQVQDNMPSPPTYSSVRSHLRILEQKGLVIHATQRGVHWFKAVPNPQTTARSALRHVLHTYFGDCLARLVQAYLIDLGQPADLKDLRLAHQRLGQFLGVTELAGDHR